MTHKLNKGCMTHLLFDAKLPKLLVSASLKQATCRYILTKQCPKGIKLMTASGITNVK